MSLTTKDMQEVSRRLQQHKLCELYKLEQARKIVRECLQKDILDEAILLAGTAFLAQDRHNGFVYIVEISHDLEKGWRRQTMYPTDMQTSQEWRKYKERDRSKLP
jgi:hypothetical protein